MSLARPIPAFGTWDQERLFVLISLEELRGDLRRQAELLAVQQQKHITKLEADVGAAHEKIRRLEAERDSLRTRNWVTTSALSAALAALYEAVKALFHGR